MSKSISKKFENEKMSSMFLDPENYMGKLDPRAVWMKDAPACGYCRK